MSLLRLITDVQANSTLRKRSTFVGGYCWLEDAETVALAHKVFDAFAQAGGEDIDPQLLQGHVDSLEADCSKIERFADRCLAHAQVLPEEWFYPSLSEVEGALHRQWSLFLQYHELVTGSPFVSDLPAILEEWESIFDAPWRLALPPSPQEVA